MKTFARLLLAGLLSSAAAAHQQPPAPDAAETEALAQLEAEGAVSVKNYDQPRREQRQMVVEAARQENMLVVAGGGSLYTELGASMSDVVRTRTCIVAAEEGGSGRRGA